MLNVLDEDSKEFQVWAGRAGAPGVAADVVLTTAPKTTAPKPSGGRRVAVPSQHQRKKLENRRLDYDAKRTNLAKSKKEDKSDLEAEVLMAKTKFEETIGTLRDVMLKIAANEVGGRPGARPRLPCARAPRPPWSLRSPDSTIAASRRTERQARAG